MIIIIEVESSYEITININRYKMSFKLKKYVLPVKNVTDLCFIMYVILLTVILHIVEASPVPTQNDSAPSGNLKMK